MLLWFKGSGMPCASGRCSGERAGGMCLEVKLDDAGASGVNAHQLEHSSAGMQDIIVAQRLLRVICMLRFGLSDRTKANLLRTNALKSQRMRASAQ